jgi:trafficking protein particle complex subunit 10
MNQDTDAEVYRSLLKRQIKEWHTIVTARKNQEWLIVQMVRADNKMQGNTFFQLKGSVIDKIKADFNVDKRDRYVYVKYEAE